MAKAKKLPSGSWRCLVYDYTDGAGKRHYRSFTSDDPSPAGRREAEAAAANFAFSKESKTGARDKTVKTIIEQYLTAKEKVLSPSTYRSHRINQRLHFSELNDIAIKNLDSETVQKWISSLAIKHLTPKTIKNIYGLFTAAVSMTYPDKKFRVQLPAARKPDLYVPSDSDISVLIDYIADDKDLLLAVLLAAFGPLRRGEICALEYTDIRGNIVTVNKGMVLDNTNNWVVKSPKTYQSNRNITIPSFIADNIPKGKTGRIISSTPAQISDRFRVALGHTGLPHFRFHDLRHYSASIMHAIGIPDQYIIERGGWNTDGVMKQIYRNTINDVAAAMNQKANDHFASIISDLNKQAE